MLDVLILWGGGVGGVELMSYNPPPRRLEPPYLKEWFDNQRDMAGRDRPPPPPPSPPSPPPPPPPSVDRMICSTPDSWVRRCRLTSG